MKTYTIFQKKDHNNKAPKLFSGMYDSFKSCLEDAVKQGTNLSHANLKQTNLANANLDNARLDHADFSYANLTGANLSEGSLRYAKFTGTSLYNCCLAESDLRYTDWRFAYLGATDFTGTLLSDAILFEYDAHKVNWSNLKKMLNVKLENNAQTTRNISTPPVIILGLKKQPLVVNNNIWGCTR